MAAMTTSSSGPEHPAANGPADADPRTGDSIGASAPEGDRPQALDGWSVLPLAVRISDRTAVPDIDTVDLLDPEGQQPITELIPTAQGIRKALGHHRAVAAAAQGPDYLQLAVLIDDSGRTATVGEHGAVVPGEGVEEIAASIHRITGQQLEPQHPRLRRALLQQIDAPDLPLLASATGAAFRAATRDGWSILVAEDEAAWWALRNGITGTAVALASDGAARSLEVLLAAPEAPAGAAQDAPELAPGFEAACGLSWGPHWEPVSIDDDGTAAARLTREVVDLCGAGTPEVHIESVASVFDLDPVQATRLRNYVLGDSSSLVLESVLQLLGLPVLAAKIVEGQKELDDVEGLSRYEPSSTAQAVLRGLTERPTRPGAWSDLQMRLQRRPELLLALAGTETAAGVGLAALARRGGRGSRLFGTLSGLAFADAATVSALYAALRRRRGEDTEPGSAD